MFCEPAHKAVYMVIGAVCVCSITRFPLTPRATDIVHLRAALPGRNLMRKFWILGTRFFFSCAVARYTF